MDDRQGEGSSGAAGAFAAGLAALQARGAAGRGSGGRARRRRHYLQPCQQLALLEQLRLEIEQHLLDLHIEKEVGPRG